MPFLLVAVVVYFGITLHSVLGFGVALICMPFLIGILGPASAAALVAIFTVPLQLVIIWRYRHSLNVRPFWRVIVGSALGIPLGVFLLVQLDRQIVLSALGIFLIVYSLYSLLNLHLPEIRRPGWGFGFGFISGLLAGAYNTGGPPIVIYGTSLRWKPEQFKANLQALFLISDPLVIFAHLAAGHIDAVVVQATLVALPAVALGTATGFWLSRYVNETLFRRGVLVMLCVIGVRLLLP